MIARNAVVNEAREWVGTRWSHQAMLKGVKTDCFGLILGVAVELELPGSNTAVTDPRLKGYGREPDYDLALAALREYMQEIPTAGATLGDVLYMKAHRGLEPQHFGIISQTNPPYMIHAWAASRGVVETRIDELWQSRVSHAFHFRGVA